MDQLQEEASIDSIAEEIKTEPTASSPKSEEDDEIILQSIDESDISSVQSLPDDLAKSLNYSGKLFRLTNEREAHVQTPELTARTPRTQRTVSFTDDFEPDSVDPRGAISEPPTARTIPSTAYSSDFESSWQNEEFKKEQSTESVRTSVPRKSKTDRSFSLDAAGRSYSAESFETETDRSEFSESESLSSTKTSILETSEFDDDTESCEDESSVSYTETSFQPDSQKESFRNQDVLQDDERRFIDAKYDFFVKKLLLLERKNRGEYQVKPPLEPDEKESRIQKSYCQKKVQLMRNKRRGSGGRGTNEENFAVKPVTIFDQIANDPIENHGIPKAALHRLQMQNTMQNLKKAASVKIHNPKNCKDCKEKLAEMTERSFLQQKLAVVSEKLLKDKLLMQKNPALEFASGLKDFPSLKDDPASVYDQLMKSAQRKSLESKENASIGVQTVESRPPEPLIRRLKDYTEAELKLDSTDLANKPPEQFWNKYFEPLNDCTWFPKSS